MKHKLTGTIAAIALGLFLVGCEKERDFFADAKAGASNGAGFGLSNRDGIVLAVDASVTNLDTAVKAYISTTYGSATNLTVAVDTVVVDNYNSDNGTAFDYLPSDSYTAPTSISIPAGQKEGKGVLSVNIQQLLTHGTAFALGLSITQASGGTSTVLNDNSHLVVIVQVKNPYDADYTVKGFLFHPSSPRAVSTTKHLTTVGAVTSYGDIGDLGGAGYHFIFDVDGSNNLTNWVAAGSCPPAPSSGFFTLDNPGGTDYSVAAPFNPGTAPYIQATYNNTYDPAAQTFWMHYGYGGGSSSQTGWTRQIYESWVRQ